MDDRPSHLESDLQVSLPEPRRAGPLVFMHILKVGGYSICQEMFSRTVLDRIYNGSPEQYDALDPATVGDIDLFVGHFSYRHLRNIPPPSFVFSMVRDPLDRILSNYIFFRDQASLTDAPYLQRQILLAREHTFAEYIERLPETGIICSNLQTSAFADDWLAPRSTGENALKLAFDHTKAFDLVGIFERYDESLQMLCTRLGWMPWPSEVRLNTSRKSERVADLDDRTLKLLRKQNESDIELYAYLADRFDNEYREHLRDFVRMNAIRRRQDVSAAAPPPKAVDLFADAPIEGEGWYAREITNGAYVRWLGPGKSATVTTPIDRSSALKVDLYIMGWIDLETMGSLALFVDGEPCELIQYDIDEAKGGAVKGWRVPSSRRMEQLDHIELVIRVDRTGPIESVTFLPGDTRFGSVAVSAVRLAPLEVPPGKDVQPAAAEHVESGK